MSAATTVKRIKFWVGLALSIVVATAGAAWAVADKVHAVETRMAVIEICHVNDDKRLDWIVDTLWAGRPLSPPPERKAP